MKRCTALALLLCGGLLAATRKWVVKPNGTTKINSRLGAYEITITTLTREIPYRANGKASLSDLIKSIQCTGEDPCIITSRMVIKINHKLLYSGVPSYGDIHYIALALKRGILNIEILGGDAIHSYNIVYKITNGMILEKDKYDGEDPNHPYEICRYYNIILGP